MCFRDRLELCTIQPWNLRHEWSRCRCRSSWYQQTFKQLLLYLPYLATIRLSPGTKRKCWIGLIHSTHLYRLVKQVIFTSNVIFNIDTFSTLRCDPNTLLYNLDFDNISVTMEGFFRHALKEKKQLLVFDVVLLDIAKILLLNQDCCRSVFWVYGLSTFH